MSSLNEIQLRIGSMRELRDVVGAMRALAGMRLQETELALPAVRRYAGAMAEAMVAAQQLQPDGAVPDDAGVRGSRGGRALILCLSEHGFVGGFNEHLLEALAQQSERDDALYVLGSRGAALSMERGRVVRWTHPTATRVAGAPQVAGELYRRLMPDLAAGRIRRVEALFALHRSGGNPTIAHRKLLPPEHPSSAPMTRRQAPLHNLTAQTLLEGLVAEYLFALLTESIVESLASENAARFAAMESARDNVAHKLDELQTNAQLARQTEINAELLDLITGTEAMQRS